MRIPPEDNTSLAATTKARQRWPQTNFSIAGRDPHLSSPFQGEGLCCTTDLQCQAS